MRGKLDKVSRGPEATGLPLALVQLGWCWVSVWRKCVLGKSFGTFGPLRVLWVLEDEFPQVF